MLPPYLAQNLTNDYIRQHERDPRLRGEAPDDKPAPSSDKRRH